MQHRGGSLTRDVDTRLLLTQGASTGGIKGLESIWWRRGAAAAHLLVGVARPLPPDVLGAGMDDKTHQGRARGMGTALAPVVLVRVVVAVARTAACAEPQGAVVAVGHAAQRV